ncbi:MAG: class I SAM-dependent methyltransferase [Acidobacteria bacterium]|nr:class I SAM-dependent methyltransferase [Acidobacteriota bacterium]MBS1865419.1 class I SAM-dependent methyltransferase [Acidobacteriota bacterium]
MSTFPGMSVLSKLHETLVHRRRVRITAQLLAGEIPQGASVLDVGCGDGSIAGQIAQLRPDISIRGVEVMARPGCKVACQDFDGQHLPFADGSFDVCLMVDVLHHTPDVAVLLREGRRVGKSYILLRDHLSENSLDHFTLRLLDWFGNRPHGVRLTYNYQSRAMWEHAFAQCGLELEHWRGDASTYPPPVDWVAGRKLHFIARLKKRL